MLKLIVGVLSLVILSGCASSPYESRGSSIFEIKNPHRHGLRDHDPCIRCGEGWIFLNIDDTAHLK
jgi:hypothetical protein